MDPRSNRNNEITILESVLRNGRSRNEIVEGKRRRLLREYLGTQALKKLISDAMNHSVINERHSSEYIDEYNKLQFTPILENDDILAEQQTKFPLYGSINETVYTEKIMKDCVKKHSAMPNFYEPFRKNCNFTTPVEDRFRE